MRWAALVPLLAGCAQPALQPETWDPHVVNGAARRAAYAAAIHAVTSLGFTVVTHDADAGAVVTGWGVGAVDQFRLYVEIGDRATAVHVQCAAVSSSITRPCSSPTWRAAQVSVAETIAARAGGTYVAPEPAPTAPRAPASNNVDGPAAQAPTAADVEAETVAQVELAFAEWSESPTDAAWATRVVDNHMRWAGLGCDEPWTATWVSQSAPIAWAVSCAPAKRHVLCAAGASLERRFCGTTPDAVTRAMARAGERAPAWPASATVE